MRTSIIERPLESIYHFVMTADAWMKYLPAYFVTSIGADCHVTESVYIALTLHHIIANVIASFDD